MQIQIQVVSVIYDTKFFKFAILQICYLTFALLRFATQETCHALCACHRFACFGDCFVFLNEKFAMTN
ncbi:MULTISPECIES: hypothetical protein [unclassified Campylobacter]|uniref:hypothetical protein n=1 Tax=unclassified Campylobacter TaxID=2593542 RepID=UPI0022E9D12D|nr:MULTISPECIES: hypothetical protein [unclassified Campylobacter]MDA3089879.1 hypothetical protein [Campylobacter sp. CS_ED2]MDA3079016.1 hypothetical protein [Campylobacter sp. CS_NA2]MDA3080693.1 hypothetical protein [Campylobacter sp. CS_NA1]MDA3085102.1 hypothetical protein [Campylobacter sp. CS_ED1]WBR51564.1 hypothetical protein PF026_01615 [Campylobacter sp. CS_NA3]